MNFAKAICGRSQLTSLAFIILVYEFTHEQILTKYKTDSSVKAMVDKMDWVIMPVFNVDGYEYTFNRVSMCSDCSRALNDAFVFYHQRSNPAKI